MDNPNNMPTTADYAYASANDNKNKIKELEERIRILENRFSRLIEEPFFSPIRNEINDTF